jgi:RNA polymerase sigma-70 factor (sigma-E family)
MTYTHVLRTAYLITGDREEAEDLTQEAFARAFDRWPSVGSLERPEAWVQRVIANLAISSRRRRGSLRDRLPSLVTKDEAPMPDSSSHLDMLEALRSLTPSQRAAVALRYYADWSVDEVARALGKRPGTVRALTSQAFTRLRALLHDEEVDDEAPRG